MSTSTTTIKMGFDTIEINIVLVDTVTIFAKFNGSFEEKSFGPVF